MRIGSVVQLCIGTCGSSKLSLVAHVAVRTEKDMIQAFVHILTGYSSIIFELVIAFNG